MEFFFNNDVAANYKSKSQIARVLSEDWVVKNMYCPVCGAPILRQYKANKPVADFYCKDCASDFELKSKESPSGSINHKIVDGAYKTMIDRISSSSNPHLMVMTYRDYSVTNLMLIPKFFFVPSIIEKRTPLNENAKRSGWVGCNIEIGNIPDVGKIYIVRNGEQEEKSKVLNLYRKAVSLDTPHLESRGWMMDVLLCIDSIHSDVFRIEEIYSFADQLQRKHPNNNHVYAKIRQQLQFLRDMGFLHFESKGVYRKLR